MVVSNCINETLLSPHASVHVEVVCQTCDAGLAHRMAFFYSLRDVYLLLPKLSPRIIGGIVHVHGITRTVSLAEILVPRLF